MANLRILYDNAANRATVSASSTASASLTAANLLTDIKGQPHRSTGTSVTYTATWTALQSIGGVGLPAVNATATATIRVRLYSDTAGTTLIADSGTVLACPGLNLGMWDWGTALDCNAFAFGGASKVSVWFAAHFSARRCVIDIVDSANPAGYIDCSRLVIGSYWEPTYNAEYGVQITPTDTTQVSRNDAGDLLADNGTKHDTLSLNLALMPEADRAQLKRLYANAGTGKNLFISVLPSALSIVAEQDYMLYGKRDNSGIAMESYYTYSSSMQMQSW